MNGTDWLDDPLKEYPKLKNLRNDPRDLWHSFHFATRLKLEGAAYFCRQVLGAASIPLDIGLSYLAHRQLEWYLDAFFFELRAAYDTLLQELNIVYAYDKLKLDLDEVRWGRIKDKLPEKIADYMTKECEKEWFKKVTKYRNMTAHHYLVLTGEMRTGFGENPLYHEHELFIYYLEHDEKIKQEKINVCFDYLKEMVRFISQIWLIMKEEFQ